MVGFAEGMARVVERVGCRGETLLREFGFLGEDRGDVRGGLGGQS